MRLPLIDIRNDCVLSRRSQVKAIEAAKVSNQGTLDANNLGYQIRMSIHINVLNAQNQPFQTRRDLAQTRYNILIGGLRLRQANGTLRQEYLLLNSLLTQ